MKHAAAWVLYQFLLASIALDEARAWWRVYRCRKPNCQECQLWHEERERRSR